MKTALKNYPSIFLLFLILFIFGMESCRFSAKKVEFETIFGSGRLEEVVVDVGASVLEKAIEDNPDESGMIIKKICDQIKAYEAIADNYEQMAKGLEGVPNASSTKNNLEQMAKSFRNTAEGHKRLLSDLNIDCREYTN